MNEEQKLIIPEETEVETLPIEVPEFDLDKLAREIDEVFQEKMDTAIDSLEGNSKIILNGSVTEISAIITKAKDKLKGELTDLKQMILGEMSKGRSVINLPEGITITTGVLDHPKVEDVVKSLSQQRKAMLVGPAGTGKTYMIADIAKKLSLEFYKYSCSRDSSVHDLLGYKQPASETYLETSFLKAYENGGIFLVDEYDAMSGDMALFFNGIADNSDFISIPHRDENPNAKKHKDFYLVMCGNTWGNGSTDYSGRDFQDMALMDRFRFCRHHIGYHFELEKSWVEDYEVIKSLRAALEGVGSYLSTRNVEDMAKMLNLETPMSEILEMITQDLSEKDRNVVKENFGGYTLRPVAVQTRSRGGFSNGITDHWS